MQTNLKKTLAFICKKCGAPVVRDVIMECTPELAGDDHLNYFMTSLSCNCEGSHLMAHPYPKTPVRTNLKWLVIRWDYMIKYQLDYVNECIMKHVDIYNELQCKNSICPVLKFDLDKMDRKMKSDGNYIVKMLLCAMAHGHVWKKIDRKSSINDNYSAIYELEYKDMIFSADTPCRLWMSKRNQKFDSTAHRYEASDTMTRQLIAAIKQQLENETALQKCCAAFCKMIPIQIVHRTPLSCTECFVCPAQPPTLADQNEIECNKIVQKLFDAMNAGRKWEAIPFLSDNPDDKKKYKYSIATYAMDYNGFQYSLYNGVSEDRAELLATADHHKSCENRRDRLYPSKPVLQALVRAVKDQICSELVHKINK
jgi:hypothetical protein